MSPKKREDVEKSSPSSSSISSVPSVSSSSSRVSKDKGKSKFGALGRFVRSHTKNKSLSHIINPTPLSASLSSEENASSADSFRAKATQEEQDSSRKMTSVKHPTEIIIEDESSVSNSDISDIEGHSTQKKTSTTEDILQQPKNRSRNSKDTLEIPGRISKLFEDLLGVTVTDWPFSEGLLESLITFKMEQEKTKRESLRLNNTQQALELLNSAISYNIPTHMIPQIFCSGTIPQELCQNEDKAQLPEKGQEEESRKNQSRTSVFKVDIPQPTNFEFLHWQNPEQTINSTSDGAPTGTTGTLSTKLEDKKRKHSDGSVKNIPLTPVQTHSHRRNQSEANASRLKTFYQSNSNINQQNTTSLNHPYHSLSKSVITGGQTPLEGRRKSQLQDLHKSSLEYHNQIPQNHHHVIEHSQQHQRQHHQQHQGLQQPNQTRQEYQDKRISYNSHAGSHTTPQNDLNPRFRPQHSQQSSPYYRNMPITYEFPYIPPRPIENQQIPNQSLYNQQLQRHQHNLSSNTHQSTHPSLLPSAYVGSPYANAQISPNNNDRLQHSITPTTIRRHDLNQLHQTPQQIYPTQPLEPTNLKGKSDVNFLISTPNNPPK
ncbi:hypothetical protein WICMUC_001930 [Wickerhamomyces mucosus]|uniref:Uncharacterized protein n=1 Tax=Wickerhamomyces mucosus TaxID=1378264 RepID=A0A9P8PTH8_9ASCO|nr:hypothetical protein WICMUC_001930 [Wickerhamomyces mucosus]